MQFSLNKKSFELLYYRFKDSQYYLLGQALGIIIVSLILLLQFVIPQVSNWFSINNEIAATRDRIAILEENSKYVNSLNERELDDNLLLAYSALPSEKDFSGIVQAINSAAVKSGVQVDDYGFQIGEISSASADMKTFFPVTLSLTISSDIETAKRFFDELYQTLPVVEILSTNFDRSSATVALVFYFKAMPQGQYEIGAPINPLSREMTDLTARLRAQRDGLLFNDIPTASSSSESPF